MSDKLERDVEEVLQSIDDFDWQRKQRRGTGPIRRRTGRFLEATTRRAARFTTGGHLMVIGIVLLLIGAVLRLQAFGMWLALTGLVLFVIGLILSSRGRKNRQQPAPDEPDARGGYWRGRYVRYDDRPQGGAFRWFRRKPRE